jgi:HAE1 family hydrophobic/amphiphilic exporter-1
MIANLFIRRPITAIVISIIIVLVGVLAIIKLPISQYPDISPPTVQISGIFNGADAQTVEQTVTTPIESQVNGTPGMAYMQGNSTSDGRTSINVILNVGTDPNIAALDVQNRVSIATPLLPDDVKRLGLVTRKRTSSILLLVAM